jgi:hypothetical protein
MNSITDVSWNPKYHIIAFSGFGKDYPILIYSWESKSELNPTDFE